MPDDEHNFFDVVTYDEEDYQQNNGLYYIFDPDSLDIETGEFNLRITVQAEFPNDSSFNTFDVKLIVRNCWVERLNEGQTFP